MRTSLRVLIAAVCLVLVPLGAPAQGDRAPIDNTLSPYFFVEGGDASISAVTWTM